MEDRKGDQWESKKGANGKAQKRPMGNAEGANGKPPREPMENHKRDQWIHPMMARADSEKKAPEEPT